MSLAGFNLETAMRRTYMHIGRSAPAFAKIDRTRAVPDGLQQLQRSSAAHCRHSLPERVHVAGLLAWSRRSLDSLPTFLQRGSLRKCWRRSAVVFLQDVMRSDQALASMIHRALPCFSACAPRPLHSIARVYIRAPSGEPVSIFECSNRGDAPGSEAMPKISYLHYRSRRIAAEIFPPM